MADGSEQWSEESIVPAPSLDELAALTDEQLEARRFDPLERIAVLRHLDPADLAAMADEVADEPFEDGLLPDEPAATFLFETLDAYQRDWQRAEADRVVGALRAYRAAMAQVDGGPDAVLDGPYERSVLHALASKLRIATRTAASVVHTAYSLERSFPASWAAFVDGAAPWSALRLVHAQAQGLDPEPRAAYDREAARLLPGAQLPRLKERLHRLRERLNAGTAIERHRSAVRGRGVTLLTAEDGMADLVLHGPAAELIGIDHQLQLAAVAAAGTPGETRTVAQLRYDVIADVLIEGGRRPADPADERLSVPQRRGVEPVVHVFVPAMTLLGHSDAPATLAGYGPVDIDTAKRLAGGAKTWIRILTHPVTGTIVDVDRQRYRPPEDLRRLVTLLDGTCRCGCGRRTGDLDHVREWAIHRGRTAIDNLVLLARRDHVMKSAGQVDLRLQPDRGVVWTTIWGTRIVVPPDDPPEPTPVPSVAEPCPF